MEVAIALVVSEATVVGKSGAGETAVTSAAVPAHRLLGYSSDSWALITKDLAEHTLGLYLKILLP